MSEYLNDLSYLTDFIEVGGQAETLLNGRFWLCTRLQLQLLDAGGFRISKTNDHHARTMAGVEDKPAVKARENRGEIVSQLGYQPQLRRETVTRAKGTVYGKKSKFNMNYSRVSIFGVNPMYLTTAGAYSTSVILHKMREINLNAELKEAKLGRMFNNVFLTGPGENYVTLGVVFLMHYYKHYLTERMSVVKRKVTILCTPELKKLCADDSNIDTFISYLEKNELSVPKLSADDDAVEEMMIKIRGMTEGSVLEYFFNCWEFDDYDDGHIALAETYSDAIGFRNRYFKIPKYFKQFHDPDVVKLEKKDYVWPDEDTAIDALANYDHYLNLSGFTGDDALILKMVLAGNKRSTPLLIDQDINLVNPKTRMLKIWTAFGPETLGPIEYNSQDILRVMRLFMMNHRCHEDFRAARHICRWWIAQPGVEHAEAAWWLLLDREQNLPKLRMVRGFLPFLLTGDATGLTVEATVNYANITVLGDVGVAESLLLNTSWYWGEYLAKYNMRSSDELFSSLLQTDTDNIQYSLRAEVIASAVLGRSLPTSYLDYPCPHWQVALHGQVHKPVPVKKVTAIEIQYSRAVIGSEITWNIIVPPGCISLITGLAGDLLYSTPYSTAFTVGQVYKQGTRNINYTNVDFYDLWGGNVVNRWLGYDVYYQIRGEGPTFRSWAANGVMLSMPPVGMDYTAQNPWYYIKDIKERAHVYGDMCQMNTGQVLTFGWARQKSYVPRVPDGTSLPTCTSSLPFVPIRHIVTAQHLTEQYRLAIQAKYLVNESDFRVSTVYTTIEHPDNYGQLVGTVDPSTEANPAE